MSATPYVGSNGDIELLVDRYTGQLGPKGETGRGVKQATLRYVNIDFSVWVEPSTLAIIEDEQALNQGDLDLIQVVNKEDWLAIRKAWCAAWQMKKAHRAFELGDMEDDSF